MSSSINNPEKRFWFGIDSHVELPEDATCVGNTTVDEDDVDFVAKSTREALRTPVEYPPLADVTISEDEIAIVLEDSVPCVADVLSGLIDELLATGTTPERISVVMSPTNALSAASVLRRVDSSVRNSIRVIEHNPDDKEQLSYLGPTKSGEPVYINRQIFDADVVIPVGTIKRPRLAGNFGVCGSVYPWFSNRETLKRFQSPTSSSTKAKRKALRDETREVSWMMGTRMTIQVVPGPGENAFRVLAGDAAAVGKQGREIFQAFWGDEVPNRASLVIAAVAGDQHQQTWASFARTLDAALRVVEEDGTIAICSNLKSRPGPSLRKLVDAESIELAARAIRRDTSPDALPASRLAKALQRVRIYLYSQLDEEIVEDLGIAYVAHKEEISRLASRHKSCIGIANGQYALLEVKE